MARCPRCNQKIDFPLIITQDSDNKHEFNRPHVAIVMELMDAIYSCRACGIKLLRPTLFSRAVFYICAVVIVCLVLAIVKIKSKHDPGWSVLNDFILPIACLSVGSVSWYYIWWQFIVKFEVKENRT